MSNEQMLWLGLMTGSSADGCDMVLMQSGSGGYKCMATRHVSMSEGMRSTILDLLSPTEGELAKALRLNQELASWMGEMVILFLAEQGLQTHQIQAVGMHGQTIRHQPNEPLNYSTQLGCPSRLSAILGIPVVADFRSADIAVGGQGAPLAPFFHQAFFSDHLGQTAVLNIGGIANLSLLGEPLIGFDTGPGNALLDAWIGACLGQEYDEGGAWAASGHVIPALLKACLEDDYFSLSGPKSTGRDYFNLAWLGQKVHMQQYKPEDIQATLLHLTGYSIVNALKDHQSRVKTLVVCGGGVHNHALMDLLSSLLVECEIKSSGAFGIEPNWVEAMGFAWLAEQRLANRAIATQSVTGAKRPVVLGGIYAV